LLLITFSFLFFNENYQTATLENLHYVLLSSIYLLEGDDSVFFTTILLMFFFDVVFTNNFEN